MEGVEPTAMALECAHCGTRCDDGVTRCPRCLRTTHLVALSEASPARRTPRAALVVGALSLVAALAGGALWMRARNAPRTPPVPDHIAPSAADPLAIETAELRAVVERLRAMTDATARARTAAEEVHRRRVASIASDGAPTPPPRAPDLVWRILPSQRETVSELDLARLVAALLRAAGDARASVAERTAPARPDEPLGATGSFLTITGEHAIEVTQGTLVGAASVRHAALSESALAGAISAQASLEAAAHENAHDRAIQYANAAIEAWSDSPVPLAARARVWTLAGASGGLPLAESDLRAAVAMRDDAGLELALARVLLLRGDLVGASRAANHAAAMAPAWGDAAVALLCLRDVNAQLDAGAPDGCARLRQARAPWTDDAYALCAADTPDATRRASAQRLLDATRDPLRSAWAAASLGPDAGPALRRSLAPYDRREAASWLSLLGRGELAAAVMGLSPDGGVAR